LYKFLIENFHTLNLDDKIISAFFINYFVYHNLL